MVYLHIRHRPIYNGNAPYNEKADSIDVDETMFDDDSRLLLPIFYTDTVLFIIIMLPLTMLVFRKCRIYVFCHIIFTDNKLRKLQEDAICGCDSLDTNCRIYCHRTVCLIYRTLVVFRVTNHVNIFFRIIFSKYDFARQNLERQTDRLSQYALFEQQKSCKESINAMVQIKIVSQKDATSSSHNTAKQFRLRPLVDTINTKRCTDFNQ